MLSKTTMGNAVSNTMEPMAAAQRFSVLHRSMESFPRMWQIDLAEVYWSTAYARLE
jgi:hypothetical protein